MRQSLQRPVTSHGLWLEYQRQGVPLYWIVDGDPRTVEVWTPDAEAPRILRGADVLQWRPESAWKIFRPPLERLFRPI